MSKVFRLHSMDETLPPEKQALYRAAKILGGQGPFAVVLGYGDKRNVSPWFVTERRFPAEHAPAIERETRARGDTVTCEELCPWVEWAVVREQAAA